MLFLCGFLQNGCIQFGFHVKLLSFKVQVRSGRMPLTENWNDHIPNGRCLVPCELSHLCRVAIRRRLLGRALLPKGIFELPLPESLKKYLNLEAWMENTSNPLPSCRPDDQLNAWNLQSSCEKVGFFVLCRLRWEHKAIQTLSSYRSYFLFIKAHRFPKWLQTSWFSSLHHT